jgi:hypothetical protein
MKAKSSMIAVNMTAYPNVRKPALDAPEPIELEFAKDRQGGDRVAAVHPGCVAIGGDRW